MSENRDWREDTEKLAEIMQSLGKITTNPSITALLDKLGKIDFSAAKSMCDCCCTGVGAGGNA